MTKNEIPAAPTAQAPSVASPVEMQAEVSRLAEENPDDLLTVAHIESEDGAGTLTLEFCQLGDLASMVGEDEATYTVRIAGMKRAEFEALGDFDGF